MLPRLIWQTWKTKPALPAAFDLWRRTFLELHPGWDHWLWDDDDNAAFVAELFPWFLPRYNEYPQPICRVDAVRYLFLYNYGGFYADLDTVCLQSLDPLRNAGGVILGRMGTDPEFEHSIPDAVMAAAPRQPFWLTVVYLMLACEDLTLRPERITGPVLLKRAYDLSTNHPDTARAYASEVASKLPRDLWPEDDPGPVRVLPPWAFCPVDWSDPIHQEYFRRPLLNREITADIDALRKFYPRSYTLTFWTHSWGDWPPPLNPQVNPCAPTLLPSPASWCLPSTSGSAR